MTVQIAIRNVRREVIATALVDDEDAAFGEWPWYRSDGYAKRRLTNAEGYVDGRPDYHGVAGAMNWCLDDDTAATCDHEHCIEVRGWSRQYRAEAPLRQSLAIVRDDLDMAGATDDELAVASMVLG